MHIHKTIGKPLSSQALVNALAEQGIALPSSRMDLIYHEFTMLHRQSDLINQIVERNNFSDICTVIARFRGPR